MMPPPAPLVALAPLHLAVMEGFQAVLQNSTAWGTLNPSLPDRIDALEAALLVQMPTKAAAIMEHVRAAEANISSDVTGAAALFPDITNLLSPADDHWRSSLSTAWYLMLGKGYGRWT